MSESVQLSGAPASRSTAALTVALVSLALGGWVLIWNDDGGGPIPVVLIHNVRASVPYFLTLIALAANVALPASTPVRWIAVASASGAALATLLCSLLLLNNAGTINDAPLTAAGSVDVDNALTRAVNGQLTGVNPTVFVVAWGTVGICLLLAALFEVSALVRKR